LVTALPETQPYVEPLTEEYVRYRFARQPAPAAPPEAADPALLETWQAVEPLFWKAWLRKLRDRMIKPKGDPYRLVGEEQQGDK
jgi:hypothetical protein